MAEDKTHKSLNDFISQVKNEGLAKLTHFNVLFSIPKSITNLKTTSNFNPSNSINKMLMLCDKIDLPGLALTTNEVQVYGEHRSMPYQRIFDKVNIGFYVDTDMEVKKFFDVWMDSIINPITKNMSYYKNYITDITVFVHDIENNNRYKVILHECYPSSIGQISMDYAATGVMKLDIGMNYKYYSVENFADKQQDVSHKLINWSNNNVFDLASKTITPTGIIFNDLNMPAVTSDEFSYGFGKEYYNA